MSQNLRCNLRGTSRFDKKKSGGGGKFFLLAFLFIFFMGIILAGGFLIWDYKLKEILMPPKDKEKVESAAKSGGMLPGNTQPVPPELKKYCDEAQAALKDYDYKKAKEFAQKVLDSKIDSDNPAWERASKILSDTNIALFKSDIPTEEKILYTVQDGDALVKIAYKFNTTIEAIQKSNNMEPFDFNIVPGQTLCIYKGDWHIKVDKDEHKLYLYDGDKLFKVYTIGIGRQGRTPEGTFVITLKQKEPDWFYKGKKYPFGSKENVLGTRWMALTPTGETNPNLRGYGIHGTWEPESVGKNSSNGCIRMKNEEVNELFSIVPEKTPVTIEK